MAYPRGFAVRALVDGALRMPGIVEDVEADGYWLMLCTGERAWVPARHVQPSLRALVGAATGDDLASDSEQPQPRRLIHHDWTQGSVSPFAATGLDHEHLFTTPMATVSWVIDALRLTASDRVVDLGCGDGRFVVAAAAAADGCTAVGYDIDDRALALARCRAAVLGNHRSRLVFRCESLTDADISDATVIVAYLLPAALAKLAPRLRERLGKGPPCTAVTIRWPVPGLEESPAPGAGPGTRACSAAGVPVFFYGPRKPSQAAVDRTTRS